MLGFFYKKVGFILRFVIFDIPYDDAYSITRLRKRHL